MKEGVKPPGRGVLRPPKLTKSSPAAKGDGPPRATPTAKGLRPLSAFVCLGLFRPLGENTARSSFPETLRLGSHPKGPDGGMGG